MPYIASSTSSSNELPSKRGKGKLLDKLTKSAPIHLASYFGRLEVVKLLLSYSRRMAKKGFKQRIVDLNKRNCQGSSPLFLSAQQNSKQIVQKGNTDIIRLLIRYGAKVNKCTDYGASAVYNYGLSKRS